MKWLLAPMLLFGCADDVEPLCDPTSSSATPVIMRRGGSGLVNIGPSLFTSTSLYVDGQCNYQTTNPARMWDESRSGTLDPVAADELGRQLHFGAWTELSGEYYANVADGPTTYFSDGANTISCNGGCSEARAPSKVKEIETAFLSTAQTLWDQSVASDAPVVVIAVRGEQQASVTYVNWPLGRPIADFVPTAENERGVVEAETTAVAALKALRASFLGGEHGPFRNFIPVTVQGDYYELYLRDVLPFE